MDFRLQNQGVFCLRSDDRRAAHKGVGGVARKKRGEKWDSFPKPQRY